MSLRFALTVVASTCLLTGCPTPIIKNVTPQQPKLLSVNLLGHQVCGNFVTGDSRQWNFNCPPLPTTEPTGWQLTPLFNAYQRVNHGAIVKLETPSFTELDIRFAPGVTAWPVKQIRLGRGSPAPLTSSDNGEVEVDAQDDGMRKSWSLAFNIPACRDNAKIEIRNVYADAKSDPLVVTLLRADNERNCAGGDGVPWLADTSNNTVPARAENRGPCADGSQTKTFGACENCSPTKDPSANMYRQAEACTWDDMRSVLGYGTGGKNGCTVRQVASIAQCQN